MFLNTVPGQIHNVRVYTYYPIKNLKKVISGLVVWDGLSAIEKGYVPINYHVTIFDASTGKPLTTSNVVSH